MRHLLKTAKSGNDPWPNPRTAAAVVKDDQILGIGRHPHAGAPHAEVLAIAAAGESAKGAKLFVTLEPCTHWGRTPPCVDAIVQAGISEVIYAVADPNPKVRASAATSYLEAHGIRVRAGLCENEAIRINAPFMKHISSEKPFVTAKIATSLDGKIALSDGSSKYITGPRSRRYVHQLRAEHDVIIVGIGTLLADNPMLTVRDVRSPTQPAIIILDSSGRTPLHARIFENRSPSEIVIVVREGTDTTALEQKATILRFKQSPAAWSEILTFCSKQKWHRIFIEGGESVFTSALDSDIIDKVVWCMAPVLLGGKNSFLAYAGDGVTDINSARQLVSAQVRRLGNDILIDGFLHNPQNWTKETP